MLTAVVVGEEQEGPQLPLKVTALKSEYGVVVIRVIYIHVRARGSRKLDTVVS